ncbi:MAG TPA: DUF5606 domain-containing protein [Bacteroidia bacterium]|jgi:hypothetical protein|nr:DUF5606 domain-containing protein [Bacteroidia bacterium]
MDLSGVISISGVSGLHKVIAQTKNGVIVESLADKKRFPAYASSKISSLEDISIYTTGDDMPLKDALKKIFDKEKGNAGPDHKAAEAELINYMGAVIPEYDKERVHISDIRKLLNWYNLLQKTDLLTKEPEKAEAAHAEIPKAAGEAEHKHKAPAKKASASGAQKLKKTDAPKVKIQTARKSGAA